MTDLRYLGAVRLLPPRLRDIAGQLDKTGHAEEIRLRAGVPPSVLLSGSEQWLDGDAVSPQELDAVVEIATGASMHSARESVRAGFINAPGGYRLGLCGTVIADDGIVTGFRGISSIAIRIPREITGLGEIILSETDGKIASTLIISPPGMGKTTLLRDLVRIASDGSEKYRVLPSRVALADERGEIAAVVNGKASMYVGSRTDVLSGCPKAQAVMMLLRAMNPEIIALDEITDPEDVKAIESAANCGVRIFATVHAGSVSELRQKPLFRKLLDTNIFEIVVTIKKEEGERKYNVASQVRSND